MTQLAIASTRRRAALALLIALAATLAPIALSPAGVAAPSLGSAASA